MAHRSSAGLALRPFAYPFVELHITSGPFYSNESLSSEGERKGGPWRLPWYPVLWLRGFTEITRGGDHLELCVIE